MTAACFLVAATDANAYPQALCAGKTLDSGEAAGILAGAEDYENLWHVVIKVDGED